MSSILQAIFPCCMGRGRRGGSGAAGRSTDERTPLLGEQASQEIDTASRREQGPRSLLPHPSYNADAMRAIVHDVHTKLIPLDTANLFSSSSSSSAASSSSPVSSPSAEAASKEPVAPQSDSARGSNSTKDRPLTLVRALKLHIAEEAALEDQQLQRDGRLRRTNTSPSRAGASASGSASNELSRIGLRRKKTSGASATDSRFPSVHSLKTLARGSAVDSAAVDAEASSAGGAEEDDDLAFHTAKEAAPVLTDNRAPNASKPSKRTRLVDIWGSSPTQMDLDVERERQRESELQKVETYASRAKRALKKETGPAASQAGSGAPAGAEQSKKLTKERAAEIENDMFEKLAETISRQGPLTEIWGREETDE